MVLVGYDSNSCHFLITVLRFERYVSIFWKTSEEQARSHASSFPKTDAIPTRFRVYFPTRRPKKP